MANKYLDSVGLTYFWQKIKTFFTGTATPLMDNSNASVGTSSKLAREDHVHPSDSTKVDKVSGKGLSSNDFTDTLKSKLDGIAAKAEVNQNAFSNVKVGSTTIAADAKTDTLTLDAGTYATLTPDAINDKVTIDVNAFKILDSTINSLLIDGVYMGMDDDVAYSTHFSVCSTAAATAAKTVSAPTSSGDGHFELYQGAKIVVKFSNTNTAAVANLTLAVGDTNAAPIKYRGANLPSAGTLAANRIYDFVYDGTNWEIVGDLDTNTTYTPASASPKMDGTAAVGASSKYAREDHVHPSDTSKANLASPTFTGTPKAPTATAGTNTTQLATTEFVTTAINTAQVGAARFQAVVPNADNFNNRVNQNDYKKGYYWIVGTSGTYAGSLICEAGDFIYAVADKSGSAAQASDFAVVQGNIPGPMTTDDVDAAIAAA